MPLLITHYDIKYSFSFTQDVPAHFIKIRLQIGVFINIELWKFLSINTFLSNNFNAQVTISQGVWDIRGNVHNPIPSLFPELIFLLLSHEPFSSLKCIFWCFHWTQGWMNKKHKFLVLCSFMLTAFIDFFYSIFVFNFKCLIQRILNLLKKHIAGEQ